MRDILMSSGIKKITGITEDSWKRDRSGNISTIRPPLCIQLPGNDCIGVVRPKRFHSRLQFRCRSWENRNITWSFHVKLILPAELSLSIARSSWRRDFEDDSTRMHDYLDIMLSSIVTVLFTYTFIVQLLIALLHTSVAIVKWLESIDWSIDGEPTPERSARKRMIKGYPAQFFSIRNFKCVRKFDAILQPTAHNYYSNYCYHDYYSRRHDHRSAALLRKKLIIIE